MRPQRLQKPSCAHTRSSPDAINVNGCPCEGLASTRAPFEVYVIMLAYELL